MQRENRFRRTSASGDRTTKGPSVQFRPAAREVFLQRPDNDASQILSRSFAQFFGDLTQTAQTLQDAEHRVNMHNIARENQQQKVKGTADALKGADADPKLANDYDYTDAFSATSGAVAGQRLARDFESRVAELPTNTDIDAYADIFFKEEFGTGTGQPQFDANMAHEFRKTAEVAVAKFKSNQVIAARAKGLDTQRTGIAMRATAGDFTQEDLRNWFSQTEALMPGKEHEAKPWVLAQLVSSTSTSLKGVQRLSQVLHEKGYGPNGETFAQMFPDVAPQMENMAVDKWQSHITAEGFFAYNQMRDQLTDPSVASNPLKLGEIAAQLEQTLVTHGGYNGPYKEIRNKLEAIAGKMATSVAGHNYIDAIVSGRLTNVFDQGEINKHLGAYLTNKGIDPLSGPEGAAGAALVVKQLRGMSTDLKDNLNTALMDANDPNRQANAFVFWNALERNQNVDVTPYMTETAERTYRAIQNTLGRTGGNVAGAIALFNGDPSIKKLPADPSKADWPTLMDMPGKPQGEAMVKATTDIRKGLAETFGLTGFFGGGKADQVILAGSAETDILGTFAAALTQYRNMGDPAAIENARKHTLATVAKRYITLPAADGKMRVMPMPEGLDPTKRPGLMRNALGEDENTIDNFRTDVRQLAHKMPGLFDEPTNISTGYDHTVTPRTGLFPLMDGHGPLFLEGGQRFKVREGSGTPPAQFMETAGGAAISRPGAWKKTATDPALGEMVLSDDPAEAIKQLQASFPDYVTFFDVNRVEREAAAAEGRKVKPAFRAYYSFHLKPQKSLEELKNEFTPPADNGFSNVVTGKIRGAETQ